MPKFSIKRVLSNQCIPFTSILVLFMLNSLHAKIITVDKNGPADYDSLAAALDENNANNGDTILIIGNDIDTYVDKFKWDFQGHQRTDIKIIGNTSNPDSFPIVTISWQSNWWLQAGTTYLKNVRIRASSTIQLSLNSDRKFIAENCIFEKFTQNIFSFANESNFKASMLTISNSIFTGNTNQIFPSIATLSGSADGPYGIVNNCTFYKNNVVNNDILQNPANDLTKNRYIKIRNSIFSECSNLSSDINITKNFTNCLIPTSQVATNWGTGSVFSDNPLFVNTSNNGSGLQLQSSSPAINKAGADARPSDIAGNTRSIPDIGAWEYVGTTPTNIILSSTSISENLPVSSIIATITVEGGPSSLALSGVDANAFSISGGQLLAARIFNYEEKSSYTITITAGGSFTKNFTITITDVNDPPFGITLTNKQIKENSPVGTLVCTLKTSDEDQGSSHTYSFVAGGIDNALFSIQGNLLRIQTSPDFEIKKNYFILLQTSDGTASFQRPCTLFVTDVNDQPTGITLSKDTVLNSYPLGTLVGRLKTIDPDVPATPSTFALVTGEGSTDNGSFLIQNDSLLTKAAFDYFVKPLCSIRVRAVDTGGLIIEKQFAITVGAAPNITVEPVNRTVGVGKSTSFSVTAIGPGTLSYNWFRKDITSEQGANSQLIIPSVPLELNNKAFFCVVSNEFGVDTSVLCSLKVIPLPVITIQPHDTTTVSQGSVSFSITVTGENISYTWLKNGDPLSSTTNTQSLTSIAYADSGDSVWCIVTNDAGSVVSTKAILHVFNQPVISTQPLNSSVFDGDSASFSISATGALPLTYAWSKDGVPIGINTPNLVIPTVSMSDSNAAFQCLVTNIHGSAVSSIATLTVNRSIPKITVQPRTITIPDGNAGFVSLVAIGTPVLTYAWYKTEEATILSKTDILLFNSVAKADSGSSYYCLISNDRGTIVSDTIKLLVGLVPPKFDKNPPKTKIAYIGDTVRIVVSAVGSKPSTFTWSKVEDPTFTLTNDTLIIANSTPINNGSYYCTVSNAVGTAVSDTLNLTVLDRPLAPVITKQPKKVDIYVGDSARFTISATGNPSPLFRWLLNGAPIAGKIDSTLVIGGIIDSLSYIRCIVSNNVDTLYSDSVALKVLQKPKAQFAANITIAPESTTVSFTDQSLGPIASRLWNFGDGSTSTETNPVHLYTTPGLYTVSLKVSSNAINSDSIAKINYISIYQRGGNPVRITARYLSDRNIWIRLANLNLVDTSAPVPYADSLGLWTQPNTLPLDSKAPTLLTYNKSIFSSNLGIFEDTITIPGTDSVIGLMTGLFYDDKQISKFDSIKGTLLLLKDTLTPPNQLTVQSSLLGGDSVRFTINVPLNASIDPSWLDSIFISYSTDSLQLSTTGLHKIGISASTFFSRPIPSEFPIVVHNNLFQLQDTSIYYTLSVKAKNGKMSQTEISNFPTSTSSSNNPIVLQGITQSPSTIKLYWKKFVDPSVTGIRIYYGVNEIPIGMIYPTIVMDALRPRTQDTTFTANLLNSNTTYYFGAQVQKKDSANVYTWSEITKESRLVITTPQPTADSVINSIMISTLRFDPGTAELKVNWCLTKSISDSLEIGITTSTERYPTLLSNPQTISVINECDAATIILRTPTLFDTLYYVALWLRRVNGPWSEPTDNSQDTVRTPKFTSQPVVLFTEGFDTVRVNNGNILLWKDRKFPSTATPENDTVVAFNNITGYKGMIPAGQGFSFAKKSNIPEFYIGVHYVLPPGYTNSDIRLYRDKGGLLYLEHQYGIDELNKIIYIKTNNLNNSFVPLIDTLPPIVTLLSDTSEIVYPLVAYTEPIKVEDNIQNTKISHFFSKGNEISSAHQDTITNSSGSTTILYIPANIVMGIAGVRSSIEVSDGRSTISINTSRRVRRFSSDEGVSDPLQWRPIYVTADLTDKTPDTLFSIFNKSDSAAYDTRFIRLFRWYPTADNVRTPDNKWVEYSPLTPDIFTLTPGTLMWIKTKTSKAYNFGEGSTISLKDNVAITLPAKEWTDLALPFKFSTSISQIVALNSDAAQLHYYKWDKDNTKRYTTTQISVTGLPTQSGMLDKNNEFSIYNPADTAITIKIPPIPASSTESELSKTQEKAAWWVTVKAHLNDSSDVPTVYCGYSPGNVNSWYPTPPTFNLSKIKIFNRDEDKSYGHFVEGNQSEGIAKELMFLNESDSTLTFHYKTETEGRFPKNFQTSLLQPHTKEWQPSGTGTVTVNAHSKEYRWLVTGTTTFRESFLNKSFSLKYALHSLYPNPARSRLNIRYSVPISSKEKLAFSIYDVLGRRVWQKVITEPLTSGVHNLIWDGHNQNRVQIQAGTYVVVLNVIGENGSAIHRFETRLTYLP